MKRTLRMSTMILVLIVALFAITSARNSSPNPNSVSAAWPELIASMKKMHVAMTSVKSSGNSDADFVSLMISHHQAAIDMAKTELLRGKDPQMYRLAQEIITDQQSELDLMQLWSKRHQSK